MSPYQYYTRGKQGFFFFFFFCILFVKNLGTYECIGICICFWFILSRINTKFNFLLVSEYLCTIFVFVLIWNLNSFNFLQISENIINAIYIHSIQKFMTCQFKAKLTSSNQA